MLKWFNNLEPRLMGETVSKMERKVCRKSDLVFFVNDKPSANGEVHEIWNNEYNLHFYVYINNIQEAILFQTKEELSSFWETGNIDESRAFQTDLHTYKSGNLFGWFIKNKIFGFEIPNEDIHFGHLGNGTTVWDSFRESSEGDYVQLAHISTAGVIEWYDDNISDEGRAEILNFARS